MKKYLFIFASIWALCSNAQISTFDKERKVETPAPSIVKYDSLTNIEFYNKNNGPDTDYNHFYSEGKRNEENLAHLLGQKLYFYGDTAEMAKDSWLFFYKMNNGKNKKKQPYIYYPYTDFLNKHFTLVGFTVNDFTSNIFKLIPENECDTLYCRMNNFIRCDYWTVEGFYEKAKKDFLHKEYVLTEDYRSYEKENWLYSLEDDHCGEKLPRNSVWECTDVTLKGYNNHMSLSNVILVFTNKDYGKYYIYLDKYRNAGLKARRNRNTLDLFKPKAEFDNVLAGRTAKYDSYKGKSFIYQNKYKFYPVYSLANKQKYNGEIAENSEFLCTDISFLDNNQFKMIFILHNETYGDLFVFEHDFSGLFKSKEDYLLAKQKDEQRRKQILAKYGQRNGQLILDGKVRLGFTKAMCVEAWGEPEDINKTSGSWGVHEQWCYSDGSYLYFENGKLTSIQN